MVTSPRRTALATVVLCLLPLLAVVQPAQAAPTAGLRAYFVITAPGGTRAVAPAVTRAGGQVYATYDEIGVIVAHSAQPAFAATIRTAAGVQQAGATRTSDVPAAAANPQIPPAPPQTGGQQPETERADMTQIGADSAWTKNPGSKKVTVAVLDTGVDDQHPDLKANFDPAKSASCAYGKVDTRAGAWRPVGDHGTHVAGTIAAAKDGKGMVGVAPGVKVSSIRVAEAGSELFFPENTVCSFMFAAAKGVDVTNNSYYVDPWMFVCPNQPDQAAILEAVKRSVAYAEGKGVLNIAAAGNEDYDLANKTTDASSPNDSTPANRPVANDCLDLPAELPGVVSVSAVDSTNAKAGFSNFGAGKIHLGAPGTDVYSTVPGGDYASNSGTSMASPHVAGVAGLLASVHPGDSPADLRKKLATQADDLPCPSGGQECTGPESNNSFFGEGLTDAAEAVGAPRSSKPGSEPEGLQEPGDQFAFTGAPVVGPELTSGGAAGGGGIKIAGLPPGLTVGKTGFIGGVPSKAGDYPVTVNGPGPDGERVSVEFVWHVFGFN
jgi:subtilisin family serine protease